MKRYFVEGIEVAEEQAKEIQKKDREIMESGDFIAMLGIKIIVVI